MYFYFTKSYEKTKLMYFTFIFSFKFTVFLWKLIMSLRLQVLMFEVFISYKKSGFQTLYAFYLKVYKSNKTKNMFL